MGCTIQCMKWVMMSLGDPGLLLCFIEGQSVVLTHHVRYSEILFVRYRPSVHDIL